MSKRTRRRRGLTLAQRVEAAITLAKIEALPLRRSNQALAANKVKRAVDLALKTNHARFVTLNQSRGRGAHYRMPDGSALCAEFVKQVSQ